MKRLCLFFLLLPSAAGQKACEFFTTAAGAAEKNGEKGSSSQKGDIVLTINTKEVGTDSLYGTKGYCTKCNGENGAGEYIMQSVLSEFNQADVDDSGFVDEKELFQYATRNALEGLSCPDVMDNDDDHNPWEDMVMFIPQSKYTDMQHYVGQLVDLDDDGQITIEEWDFVYYFLCDSDMSIDADGDRDSEVIQYAKKDFNLIEGCEFDQDGGIKDAEDNLELKLWVKESYEKEAEFKNQNLIDLFKTDGTKTTDEVNEELSKVKGEDVKKWTVTSLTKMWIDYGDNEGCCGKTDKKYIEPEKLKGKFIPTVSSWYCTECYTHNAWMPSMRDDSRVDTLK